MIAKLDGGVIKRHTGQSTPTAARENAPLPIEPLERALDATRGWLLDRQRSDGHWVGELEGDTILESEYILLLAYLKQSDEALVAKFCKYLFEHRRPEGGWAIYPGGPMDLSASVKAYFALKLAGMSTDHPEMVRARDLILEAGGAQACNSYTRFYLALLGQISYDDCPYVPPELVLLPTRLGFSIYDMSSWTRTMVVPLAILSALRPVRALPEGLGIEELFRPDLPPPSRRTEHPWSWANFFLAVDRGLKVADRIIPKFLRRPALASAHRWMLNHFENSDGLGAIFPAMVYSVVALRSLGYEPNSAPVRWAMEQLEDLIIEEPDSARVQPCVSPVWDTAIAMIALADAGVPADSPALVRSAQWLIDREIRTPGDWQKRRSGIEPTGWCFQYRNDFFPDIDDTAMVLLALQRTALAKEPAAQAAIQRGVDWLLAMQNKDGGWAAYDVDINNQILTKLPFADHNAMLDPSCADITARILEVLGTLGYRAEHPSVARALEYLWSTQEPQGCWYGRWGANYIYGTWQVLLGLQAIDFPMDHPAPRRAADWLETVQQASGGWGESCDSYEDPANMGRGPATPSQTAWAVNGLLAAGRADGDAIRRGVEYLLATQNSEGIWDEDAFTGTGFPRVFYLKYHYYRINFPLMALARYRAATAVNRWVPTNPGALACRVPARPEPFDV